jgi:hypothetical protein
MQTTGLLCLMAGFGLAGPAHADVTVTQTTSGKAAIMNVGGQSTTRIKGNKMRIDQTRGDDTLSTILDIDGQQMISLDSKKKEATIMPLAQIQEAMSKVASSPSALKTKVTPTSEKKQVAGFSCTVYDVGIAMPFSPTGSEDMALTMTMSGPACLSKDVPGYADFARLYRSAAEKGFIFGDPRQAKGPAASQAKGITELYRAMAEAGVALEQTMNIGFEGSGPMAAMMSRMGKSSMTTTVVKIEEGDVAADLFAVPADYKVKKQ